MTTIDTRATGSDAPDSAAVVSDADLYKATEPFAHESRVRSWLHVISTLVALALVLSLAAWLPDWPGRAAASVIGALIMVRGFILYHDHWHGALLRGSKIADALFGLGGLLVLTPVRIWRYSHNYHHAHIGKPVKPGSREGQMPLMISDVGSFPLMTVEQWRGASRWHRLKYRISRHPLTILFAGITVFAISLCLIPFLRNPRRYYDGLLALLLYSGIVVAVSLTAGFDTALYVLILPFFVSSACGAFLFYVQHTYPGARLAAEGEWSIYRAALESAGYLKLGPIAAWFTGNIGYHHVHHLNSRIPFYRLPEAMAAIPVLQQPPVTTLRLRDIVACLRLNLWDSTTEQLVPYSAGRS